MVGVLRDTSMQLILIFMGFQTVKDASTSQDRIIELFDRIERFFRRLEIFADITPTTAMRDIIIDIMVEVLRILAIATTEVKRGRWSELVSRRFNHSRLTVYLEKYMKKLRGNTDIEDSLQRLDKLTQEEARMASAELLKMTYSIDDKVKSIEGKVQDVRDVHDVDHRVQGIDSDVKDISSEVRRVDDELDTVNRSFPL